MKGWLRTVLISLLVVLAACGIFVWKFARTPGPLEYACDFVLPKGSTGAIINKLVDARILPAGDRNIWALRLLIWITSKKGPLHAGELHFPAHASPLQVLNILRHAPPVCHRVTIAEGLTAREITQHLENVPFLSGPVPSFSEGGVMPQTLCFLRDTPRAQVVSRLKTLMRRRLNEVWEARSAHLPLKTPEELLVLASMVERETALAQERPLIAEVFLNRLRKGMKLQSDPTVIYDLSTGLGYLSHRLTKKDLQRVGPHNTYEHNGLPDGPICSPGLASLQAVAHPSQGDLLYFVANGKGGHIFTKNLADHNAAISKLRAMR